MVNLKFIELEQGTQEWLDFRKMKIGSSMAASILGVGFKTPLQLFEDIIEDKSTPVTRAMSRGTELEPIARAFINREYDVDLKPAVLQNPNPKYDWHISSVDGLCECQGTYFVCEIKCPGKIDHDMALDGKVPEKYIPQCYHILEDMPGVERILYFSFSGDQHAQVWVERDEKKMREQFEKEEEFYHRLLSFNPPAPTDQDWVQCYGTVIEEKANRYKYLKDSIEAAQKELDNLKEELIIDSGLNPRSKIGDLKIQKVIRQGNVDYAKIEALRGVDLNPYRKAPIVSWRVC